MPQLDFYWYASQLFWLVVTFSVLYFGLSRKALPRLSETLQGRRERIADDLEAAESSRQRAETLEAELRDQRLEAQGRAQALIAESQQASEALAHERHADLDKILNRKIKEAEAAIQKAREDVKTRIIPVATELTEAVVNRAANLNIPREKIERAVQKIVEENKYV